jgi:hypothetical protein
MKCEKLYDIEVGEMKCEKFGCCDEQVVAEATGWGWGPGSLGMQVCEKHADEAEGDGADVSRYEIADKGQR